MMLPTVKQDNAVTVKPSWPRRLARSCDRMITACREWLERPDKPSARLAAKFVLILSAVYLAAQVVLWLWRGG
ncbi:MAG: hypothetical protein ACOX0T_03035 [Pelotomaculum sp.]|jgi:hypothetical protein